MADLVRPGEPFRCDRCGKFHAGMCAPISPVAIVDRLARAILDTNFKLSPLAGLPIKEVEAVALAAGVIVELESVGLDLTIEPQSPGTTEEGRGT